MAKATSRKHATHRKTRAHHAAKPHARRATGSKPSGSGDMTPKETVVLEAEIVDDESTIRPDPRISEEAEEEIGIYGASRGENAGDDGEATG